MFYPAAHLNDVDFFSPVVPDFEFLGVSFHILCDSNSTHLPQNTWNIPIWVRFTSLFWKQSNIVDKLHICIFSDQNQVILPGSWDLNGIFWNPDLPKRLLIGRTIETKYPSFNLYLKIKHECSTTFPEYEFSDSDHEFLDEACAMRH